MDAKPEAHAEGSVNDATEHKALDRACHRTPIVYDHDVQYNGDDRPYNSVDDFKSFHIHVVLICLIVLRYFLPPYRVIVEVPSNPHVLVVCVYSVCAFRLSRSPIVLTLFSFCITSCAPSDVLTATRSQPLGGFWRTTEDFELAIVRDRYELLLLHFNQSWVVSRRV